MTAAIVQFALLLAFWFVLSGRFSPLFVVMGVVSAAVVTAMTHRVMAEVLGPPVGGAATALRRVWRFAAYVAWLLTCIPPAVYQIARSVLDPDLPCQPALLVFRTRLASPVARTILANSISLVPGTLTVDVTDDGVFTVHAFTPDAADDLVSATLQNRIADVFLAGHEQAPEVRWEPDIRRRP